MEQPCWAFSQDRGFLMNPDPIKDLRTVNTPLTSESVDHLQTLAEQLPDLIRNQQIRSQIDALPVYPIHWLGETDDSHLVERLFQIYAHLAQAYVWCENDNPMKHIPAGVAVPFVALAKLVDRPPIIPYAMTALSNYHRLELQGPIEVENLRCVQKMIDIPDETWFHIVHIEIEAHAGGAIHACLIATTAAEEANTEAAMTALHKVADGIDKMIRTFKRMPEGCSPDVYYHTLRPYLFGFDDIVYEGVTEFGGKPQSFRGETGAQSTAVPALKTFLGLQHAPGGLSEHLEIMQDYMPKPHREFLHAINPTLIRDFVIQQKNASLRDAYNHCLDRIVSFRSLHLHFAHSYIASKVENPMGTGGTDFMHWLKQLRDETKEQLIS
ncbi:MAG: hypothetical protein AAF629_21850 [Chloroflexota bacterium]